MPVCDVIAAGCACKGAGSNSVGARRSIHWTDVLAEKQARGAGLVVEASLRPSVQADLLATATQLASWESVPEQAWPVGTVARLAEPYEVDRGAYATAAQVTRFVKKSSGRWFSDPGADVSFASLFELAGRAAIAEVTVPWGAEDPADPPPVPKEVGTAPATAPREGEEGDGLPDAQDAIQDAALPVKDGYSESDAQVSRGLLIGGGIVGVLALAGVAWWLFK